MGDDGIGFVPLHHADIKKPSVLGVHRTMQPATVAIAVILRGLNQPHAGIGKGRHQVLEPIRMHDVIGIKHADHFRIGRGVSECKPQGSCLKPGETFYPHKLEPFAKSAAMVGDRCPQVAIGCVVDDDDALKVRVIEACDCVQGPHQHLGRLTVSRDVDRDLRKESCRGVDWAGQQATGCTRKGDGSELGYPRAHDGEQGDNQWQAEAEGDRLAEDELVTMPVGDDTRAPLTQGVIGSCEQGSLFNRCAR